MVFVLECVAVVFMVDNEWVRDGGEYGGCGDV